MIAAAGDDLVREGDAARARGDAKAAATRYLEAARAVELPASPLCLKLARSLHDAGDEDGALEWVLRVVDGGDDFRSWHAAATLLERITARRPLQARRQTRLALLSTHNASVLLPLLRLVCAREGIELVPHETPYGQYHQPLLDPGSELARFAPDLALLVPHTGDLGLSPFADDADALVDREVTRWTQPWEAATALGIGRIVQHLFVVPASSALGHVAATLPGSDVSIVRALNQRLAAAAPAAGVAVVDVDRIAASVGRDRWSDDRYWYVAKQTVAMGALPALARHTAAVVAATLGLSKKCLVVDLDGTLWGGVIGDDGLAGIVLGGGPDGEAFVAVQQQVKRLAQRGVIVAVVSKNDDATAREPFTRHPDMVLTLDDIAAFSCSWDSKPTGLRRIADELGIGLDAMVLLDDNPAERQAIREELPEVDVIQLPRDPSGYAGALASYLKFETVAFTGEDRQRGAQYRARTAASVLSASATSVEDHQRSLDMRATVAAIDELSLPRVVQLLGKTNQFNLTTRRHDTAAVRRFMADDRAAALTLRLADRFTDHGLVAVSIGVRDGDVMDIDTLVMSCRVIGRGAEIVLVEALADAARRHGCRRLRGRYEPSDRNGLVANLYATLGFTMVEGDGGVTIWEADVVAGAPVRNSVMTVDRDEGTG